MNPEYIVELDAGLYLDGMDKGLIFATKRRHKAKRYKTRRAARADKDKAKRLAPYKFRAAWVVLAEKKSGNSEFVDHNPGNIMSKETCVCVFCKKCDKPFSVGVARYIAIDPEWAAENKKYKDQGFRVEMVDDFDGVWCRCKDKEEKSGPVETQMDLFQQEETV